MCISLYLCECFAFFGGLLVHILHPMNHVITLISKWCKIMKRRSPLKVVAGSISSISLWTKDATHPSGIGYVLPRWLEEKEDHLLRPYGSNTDSSQMVKQCQACTNWDAPVNVFFLSVWLIQIGSPPLTTFLSNTWSFALDFWSFLYLHLSLLKVQHGPAQAKICMQRYSTTAISCNLCT